MSIKVSIADDHVMVTNGIKLMLEPYRNIILMNAYLNGEDLLKGLKTERPDVLLLDIQMPGITGDKLAPTINKLYPDIKILVLTNIDSAYYAKNLLQHGALGYLLKNTDENTLIQAIESVYNNREYIEPIIKKQLEERTLKANRSSVGFPQITPREKDIIQLIANGYTTQRITETLHLSISTVENYRYNLLLKFGAENTGQLIKKAVQMGLVE